MKKTIILIALFLIAASVFGQEFTFRGHRWGASVDSVIAKEGKPESSTNGQLIYHNVPVAGYNATLFFYCNIDNQKLTSTRYVIGVNNTNYQVIYNDLLRKLNALYGSPTSDNKYSQNSLDEYNYWAVSKTLVSLTLIVDANIKEQKGTLIFIDYHSPLSKHNHLSNL